MMSEEQEYGMETRSRSRSKTPGRVLVKDIAKIPTVVSISEEEESPLKASTGKKTKKQVQVQSKELTTRETFSSEQLVSSTTTVVTSTARKASKKQLSSSPSKRATKPSQKTKEISQNEKNMLLETSIEAIRQNISTNGSAIDNIAYQEYKEAGEYWNKYPKTDYTYSKLSPHRREIAPGQVGMPNMSRKGLDMHQGRVITMIERNPEQESYIRERYQTRSLAARPVVQYDSGDEFDYNLFEKRTILSSSTVEKKTIIRRFWSMITTVFHYFTSIFNLSSNKDDESLYYTRVATNRGIFYKATSVLSNVALIVLKKVYLLISTILLWDTWCLLSRSTYTKGQRKRRFLLFLFFLLPILLLAALLASREENPTQYIYVPVSIPKFSSQPIINYLTKWSWPTIPTLAMPAFTLNWFRSSQAPPVIHVSDGILDESNMAKILAHIDSYIEKIVHEKLAEQKISSQQEIMKLLLNDNQMLFFVRNVVKESTLEQKYVLSEADVERVGDKVKEYLSGYLIDLRNNFRTEEGVEKERVLNELKVHVGQLQANQARPKVEPDIDEIVMKVIDSPQFSNWLLSYLNDWNAKARTKHEKDMELLKQEFQELRVSLLEEIENRKNLGESLAGLETRNYDEKVQWINLNDKQQNDLKLLLNDLKMRIDALENTQSDLIDAAVRKQLLILFEHPTTENASLADLLIWIKSIFVTRDYLEERLQTLNQKNDDKVEGELKKQGALLLGDVLSKVQNELKLLTTKESTSKIDVDEMYIRRIVREILAIYDADKTALPDYALETAGGQVISTRCTKFYQRKTAQISIFGIPLWYQQSTPRIAITPSIHPGQCWAFTGFPGYLVVQLSRLIHVTGFTIEHIPKTLAPNGTIESAPKNFIVMGLQHEYDKEPAYFGHYEFKEDGEPLQYFSVQNVTITRPHEFVEMRIDTNHGHANYTCLYRFRVHGIPV